MSEFHRMITYLYLYEHGKKGHNIGFAKIEKRDIHCRVEIHMKNTGYSIAPIPVYFYTQKQQEFGGILLGNISLSHGNGDFKIILNTENLADSGYSLDTITGIFIPLSEQIMFVSQWNDTEFIRERFTVLEKDSLIKEVDKEKNNVHTHSSSIQNVPQNTQASSTQSSLQNTQTSSTQNVPQHAQASSTQNAPQNTQTSSTQNVPQHTQASSTQSSPQNTQTSSTQNVPQHAQASSTQSSPQNTQASSTQNVPQNTQTSSTQNVPQHAQASSTQNVPQNTQASSTQNVPQNMVQSTVKTIRESATTSAAKTPPSSCQAIHPSAQTTKNNSMAANLKAAEAVPKNCRNMYKRNSMHPSSGQQKSPENWELKWKFILENYPIMTPFAGDENTLCVRFELKDLRMLPRQYWYLGNNSFLLHGFFNYRYLILGMTKTNGNKRWFLGIPGVFQNPERVMASLFGFPEFRNEKSAPVNTGEFGYWFRYLEE